MLLGLVTYQWGADLDLPTLLKYCQLSGFQGLELRTTHKHGVEPSLTDAQRRDVGKQFADAGVQLAGLGSNCLYHSPDPTVLQKQYDNLKRFIELAHDCGGTGVKVRPNALPPEVPVDKTLEQIGRAMNEVAEFGEGYGVQIRLEVHGKGTNLLPNVKKIMDAAPHPNATVCWNCNPSDMDGDGLAANFKMVDKRLGTIHIHDLKSTYPWAELFKLLKAAKFDSWTLLEEPKVPKDLVAAMKEYRKEWEKLAG